MKRFFSTSFIVLALLVGAAGVAPAAHAQSCTTVGDSCTTNGNAGTCIEVNVGTDTVLSCNASTGVTTGAAAGVINQAAGTPAPAATPDPADAYGSVMQWILKLFAWLVGVAALTLNYAVYYTVVTMGFYVKNLSAIGVTWTILRDIGNIFLIFGFLAVGVTTILNVDWYGKGTKMLPMMFVAAVFLNFSLFFTEAIIDTGNLFATQFYTQINGGGPIQPPSLSLQSVSQEGISNKIMNKLGLQTLYGDGTGNPAIFQAGNTWIIGFMGILLFITAAFVMFALAFVLIARFVILIFLIILSPVGFAGLAVPMMAKRAGQWWDKLFEQTITAPILMLMLYVALKVIVDPAFLTGFGTGNNGTGMLGWSASVTGLNNLPGLASLMLSFIVAMGLLIAVVIQSKNLSAFGATWASKTAGALTFGATAWAGRRTIGRATTAAAARFKSSKYARSNIGRLFAGGLDKVAGSSFDARGVSAFGGLKATGIDAGQAQEGGYAKIRKDATEARTKYAKTLELTPEEEKRAEQLENDQKTLGKDTKKTDNEISELNSEIKQAEKEGKDTSALRARKRSAESLKESQERRKEVLDTQVTRAKNAPQIQYAEKMQKWSTIGGPESLMGKALSVPYSLMAGPAANKDAAKKILKEAKKSKSDKDLDTLRKILEDNGGDDSGGGGPKGGGTGGAGPRGRSGGGAPASGRGGGAGPSAGGVSGGGAAPSGGGPAGAAAGAQQTEKYRGLDTIHDSQFAANEDNVVREPRRSSATDFAEEAENRMQSVGARVQAENAERERSRYRVRDVDSAETQAYAENARRDERANYYAKNRVGDVGAAQSQAVNEDARRTFNARFTATNAFETPQARANANRILASAARQGQSDSIPRAANDGPAGAAAGAQQTEKYRGPDIIHDSQFAANEDNVEAESRKPRRAA